MTRIWVWAGRHQPFVASLSGAVALVLLIAGVTLGVSRASVPQSTLAQGPFQAQPVAAQVPAGRHSVVGVIRAVGPNDILVRSQRGVFFAIRWSPGSHFRSGGQEIRPAALRPGQAVVVIGKPAADGSLVATYITVVPRPTPVAPAQTS